MNLNDAGIQQRARSLLDAIDAATEQKLQEFLISKGWISPSQETWQHKRTGERVVVVESAISDAGTDPVVIYRRADQPTGTLRFLPRNRFHDTYEEV